MTGGRIKACSKYLDSTFMLTYGDGLSDVNINSLLVSLQQRFPTHPYFC